jgi:LAS superfamily LD-carboxypeptidase LdcB
MTIQGRSIVMAALFVLASIFFGAAKYYSPSLVLHVVKQSLAQKAPSGRDSILLQERLQAFLSASPDQKTQMEELLRISAYLEKVQRLTPEELDELLSIEEPGKSSVL